MRGIATDDDPGSGGGPYYVLATSANGTQGDYSATPLTGVSDHEVGLFSGAAQTGYSIPLPPPAAGPAPEVRLNYNSASVDGMHTRKNNQPGWIGIGWNLWSGTITRHLKPCNVAQAPGDLCLTGDNYSISLNGTTSRLVKESGNLYRLQDDPHWKVELKTDGPAGHPDAQKEYWQVTTPDGTRYRFGGEIEPETGADQDSAFYVTVYDYTLPNCDAYSLCDKVWQWNLDRVEDSNGNVVSYFYEQEHNYYKARNDSRSQFRKKYVRAGHLSRIEYTKQAGQSVQPHARILFNTELRCTDPGASDGCDWPDDFPDTPGDLACEASGTCSQKSPTFWSQRRLDTVQTQIYDPAGSVWNTVGLYDLAQGFPEPPVDDQGDTSEKKLWLESITRRPGGDFAFNAFGQLEAENYSAMSGVATEETTDVGRGLDVSGTDNNDYLLFKGVDFGGGSDTVLARVASAGAGGSIEFRLDNASGTKIAAVTISNTGGGQTWTTKTAAVSGSGGVHDLYVVFKGSASNIANLNWFRFRPGSGLPGQPPVEYNYEMLANRRNYDASDVSPMFMPRVDQITTELGGVVAFSYGQSHPCPASSSSGYIRFPYDCFPAWDSGDPNNPWDDGWVLWRKWKVTQLERSDSFSGNPPETLTYGYSTPTWHYSDDPSLPDINTCSNCPTRHWNDFRGHETVTVTDATGAKSEYRFYRGMDDDRLSTWGGTFQADITLSDNSTRADSNWLRGQTAEVRRLKSDNSALNRTVNWFTWTSTAGSGVYGAYFVGLQKRENTLYGTTDKTSRVEYEYDQYGNVIAEKQHGDTSTGADDRTVLRGYDYNVADYIVDRVQWEKLKAGLHSAGGGGQTCNTYASSNVPVSIPGSGTPTVYSELPIAASGNILDLDLLNLNGTHTYINDLSFTLISPTSAQVTVMYRVCGSQNDFNIQFDDEASNPYSAIPCPPTNGESYRPQNALSAFDGQEMNGTWKLKVQDHYTNDGGSLNGWSLRICTPTPVGPGSDDLAYAEFSYDNQGNPTLARSYSSINPNVYHDTTMAYDSRGRPTSVTDANNNTTSTAYHSFYGYAESVTNALGHTTSTVSDPGWGVPLSVTDPNNRTVVSEYDAYGRLKKVWLPTEATNGPASYEFNYAPAQRPAYAQTRQLYRKESSAYLESWAYVDGFGRTLQSQRPSMTGGQRVVSSQQYNQRGQLDYSASPYQISGAAGSGYVAPAWNSLASYRHFTYDDLGNQRRSELWSYGSREWYEETITDAWQQQHLDANGHRRDYAYDGFGRLAAVTEYNTGGATYITHYSYNHRDNLTGVTDANNTTTSIGYDLLGRKTSMSDPDMGNWSYAYDGAGNLTGQTDGRGLSIVLQYDALNRLLAKRQTSAAGPLISEYNYDAAGKKGLLSTGKAYNAGGVVEVRYLTYDGRNRLTQREWVVPGGGTFDMAYSYDEANHQTAIQYPGNNSGGLGETVNRIHDAIGQLDQVIGQGNTHYVASTLYLPGGQAWRQRYDQGSNGAERRFSYETASRRLSGLTSGRDGSTTNLQNLSYGYDDAGNVTAQTDQINSGQKQCFEYDQLNRLTRAFSGNSGCTAYSATGSGPYDHDYGYNATGNLTDYDGAAYTYGSKPHAVTAAHGNSYGYDGNGNQTTRTIGSATYTLLYDYENRLTEVKQGSVTIASYLYDAGGNRVKGVVNGVTTVYIAGIYEYQNGASTKYYSGHNGVIGFRRAGYPSDNGVFYLLNDHLKSTTTVLNQNGTVQTSQLYYPYGGNRGSAFSGLTTKRFTGQYHEAGLPGGEGLYYYNARWYDAQLGRFTQADSVVPNPGNPQDLNRYSYVRGNPLRFVDPSGHWLFEDTPGDSATWYKYKAKPGITNPVYPRDHRVVPHLYGGTLVRGDSPDSFANWDEMQPGSIWAPIKAFVAGGLVYFGAAEFLGSSAGTAIESVAVATVERMATRQFLTRAGVNGAVGLLGDILGQVGFDLGDYDWKRTPGVVVPNAIGGGWFGEVYPGLTKIAYRLSAAGLTNVLVSGAQREMTGEQNSLNTSQSDFVIGTISGAGGEMVSTALDRYTGWTGSTIEAVSSFMAHTNILSAIQETYNKFTKN